MPYEPLHHRYRPQSFAELVGQHAITTTLTNALRQQKIAPAYLFTGARGTGKTSSARILAKSLNCLKDDRPTAQPCGVCEVCRSIAKGSALDVIEIDAASHTGVDNIRELIERSQFAPVQCRYKVYVIDECHMLSAAAFNALLKTLEEPPDRIVFVLATTDPQRVLPTIISRCQRFDFRRIPLEDMVRHLTTIAAQEAIAITTESIQLIAQMSQGGLRDAQSLLDQLSLLEGEITPERVWDLVGAVPEQDLLDLVNAIVRSDSTGVIDQTRQLMDRGREPLIVLQNLASFYRDLLIAKTTPDRQDLVAITASTWAAMIQLAQQFEVRTLLFSQQRLRESEVQVKNTTQPRLWLEVTLMDLLPIAQTAAASPPIVSSTQVLSQTVSPQTPPTPKPPIVAAPPTVASPDKPTETEKEPIEELVRELAVEAVIETNQELIVEPIEVEPIAAVEPSVERTDLPLSVQASDLNHPPKLEEVLPLEEPVDDPSEQTPDYDIEQIWADVLQLVQPISTRIMMSQQCQLLQFNGSEARVGARSEKLFKMAKDRLPNIEAAFNQLLNQAIVVSLEIIPSGANVATNGSHGSSGSNGSNGTPSSNQSNGLNRNYTASPPSPPEPALPPFAAPRARESTPPPRPATPPRPTEPPTTISTTPPSPAAPESISAVPLEPAIASPSHDAPTWLSQDEVRRSAESLAQFFNGEIVSVEGEEPASAPSLQEIALKANDVGFEEVDSDPDSDVPF